MPRSGQPAEYDSGKLRSNDRGLLVGGCALIVAGCAYGATPIVAKLSYDQGADVVTVTAVRCVIGLALLVVGCRLAGIHWPQRLRVAAPPLIIGALVFTPAALLYFAAFEAAPASVAVIAVYTYPAMVAAAEYRLGGAVRMDPIALGGAVVLSFGGLAVAFGATLDPKYAVGMALAILSSVFYATYVLLTGKVVRDLAVPMTTTLLVAGVTAGTLAYGLAAGGFDTQQVAQAWLTLLAQGALFAIAIGAFVIALEALGPTVAAIGDALTPIVTIALAALVLGETLGVTQLLGAALVMSGVAVAVTANHVNAPGTRGVR